VSSMRARPLSQDGRWHDRLVSDCHGRSVCIYGLWEGEPVLGAPLLHGMVGAAEIIWMALDDHAGRIAERFSALVERDLLQIVAIPETDPWEGFLGWTEYRGIMRQRRAPAGGLDDVLAFHGTPQVIVSVSSRVRDLIAIVRRTPSLLYTLDDRSFEELVGSLMEDQGYGVQLTSRGADGGVDIYATRATALGNLRFLVQCKRFAAHRRVGVGVVRELAGLVAAQHATGGAVVTSSFFTNGAEAFAETLRHRLALRNHVAIQEWLRTAR